MESPARTDAAAPRPAPRRRRWIVVTASAAVVALLAASIVAWRAHSEPAPQYQTVAVSRGTVAPSVTSSGTVNPVTTVQVGTYVSGVIDSIACDFNTRVEAGQLCATIDPRPYQVALDQASANLGMARAQLDKDRAALAYAKLIYERNADLLRRGIVSQETVDTARNVHDQAATQIALDQATIAQHEAALRAARINLGYTRIVSPVSGTVVSRNVTQGQTVAASFQTPTLFLIAADLTRMQVDTNVSESDIGRVAQGNPATFTVEAWPDRRFRGSVAQVRQAPQTVQNVVTYDVVVAVANPELRLKPGMTASVRIVTAQADQVLRVPDQALRYQPSSAPRAPAAAASAASAPGQGKPAHVWVLDRGRPRQVPVVVGLDDDDYAQIVGGDLREGEPVIVSEHAASAATTGSGGPRMPRM